MPPLSCKVNLNANPHTDFVLPAWLLSPTHRHSCLLSIASAYSRKWNPRNLEYPWYEPWAHILQALVADIPSLAVAPQFYLWHYRSPAQGDYHIEPPSNQDEDDWTEFEEANTTVDSIKTIHVPSYRNRYQVADFAITRKVSRDSEKFVPAPSKLAPQFCLSRKVEYQGIPILCEVKRGAPRTFDLCASLTAAQINLSEASNQLVRQAYHLFEMYPHQEEVLLIAVSGLWWSYYLLPCNEAKVATAQEIEFTEEQEADTRPDRRDTEVSLDIKDVKAVERILGLGNLASDERPENRSSSPCFYHGLEKLTFQEQISDSDESKIHLLMTQSNLTLRAKDWSWPLLFGTPPSNQVFYLIHRHLESIINDGYNGTKG